MREYGQMCPRCFARNSRPEIPPASEIPTGSAKLLMQSENSSCIAAMTVPPSVPNKHQMIKEWIGTAVAIPMIFPDKINRALIHSSLSRIMKVAVISFAL